VHITSALGHWTAKLDLWISIRLFKLVIYVHPLS